MKQLLASPSLQLVTYPASATAQSAEFASADCVTGLNEIGQISVSNISGDPQDVERIVALKADEQGASWYRIITMYEDQQPDNWRVQAILYACVSSTANEQCRMRRERLVRPTIFTYFIELIETSVASVVYAYTHTPPVARSNKSFWICSDNRTPPRVSNIT